MRWGARAVRGRGLGVRWVAGGGLALLAMSVLSLLAAEGAQAAAPAGSLKPFLNCYWDNGDNTVTVSIGVSSTNSSGVSVPVGADNKITQGAPDRGQPTSFAGGLNNNVWAMTVTYPEINAGINWQLAGNSVAVDAVTQCASKPMPADGNGMALLAFAVVATVVGGYSLNGRSRTRRRCSETAS
jgi:hypothetical protein